MTGLDKIINKINADTQAECDSIIKAVEEQCKAIIEQGEAQGQQLAKDMISAADKDAEKTLEIGDSAAEQFIKQSLLKARVEAINETLGKALGQLKALPDGEYFDAVIKIAADNSMPGKCLAKLGKNDLDRLPTDFAEKLSKALAEKGAECSLSSEPAETESGVLLDYGDIVVNCSFEAIIEEDADEYKALINGILF